MPMLGLLKGLLWSTLLLAATATANITITAAATTATADATATARHLLVFTPSTTCTTYNAACWVLAGDGVNCDSACGTAGTTFDLAKTNSAVAEADCRALYKLFGNPFGVVNEFIFEKDVAFQLGCHYHIDNLKNKEHVHFSPGPATGNSAADRYRFCACATDGEAPPPSPAPPTSIVDQPGCTAVKLANVYTDLPCAKSTFNLSVNLITPRYGSIPVVPVGPIISIETEGGIIPEPVIMTFVLPLNAKPSTCGWWDASSGLWRRDGCCATLEAEALVCTCKHLTDFAMLIVPVPDKNICFFILALAFAVLALYSMVVSLLLSAQLCSVSCPCHCPLVSSTKKKLSPAEILKVRNALLKHALMGAITLMRGVNTTIQYLYPRSLGVVTGLLSACHHILVFFLLASVAVEWQLVAVLPAQRKGLEGTERKCRLGQGVLALLILGVFVSLSFFRNNLLSVVGAVGLGMLFLGLGAYFLCASNSLSNTLDLHAASCSSTSSAVKSRSSSSTSSSTSSSGSKIAAISTTSRRVRRTGGIIAAALSLQAILSCVAVVIAMWPSVDRDLQCAGEPVVVEAPMLILALTIVTLTIDWLAVLSLLLLFRGTVFQLLKPKTSDLAAQKSVSTFGGSSKGNTLRNIQTRAAKPALRPSGPTLAAASRIGDILDPAPPAPPAPPRGGDGGLMDSLAPTRAAGDDKTVFQRITGKESCGGGRGQGQEQLQYQEQLQKYEQDMAEYNQKLKEYEQYEENLPASAPPILDDDVELEPMDTKGPPGMVRHADGV